MLQKNGGFLFERRDTLPLARENSARELSRIAEGMFANMALMGQEAMNRPRRQPREKTSLRT